MAILYIVAAGAALLLAIPPGYAAPFWPAAGIAVAAVLLYGQRVWPGIMAGSLAINIWVGREAITSGDEAALLLAVVISAGATLQALLAGVLVRRFVGKSLTLDTLREVSRFVFVAGPTASLINATTGPLTMLFLGIIGLNEFAFNWWNWWVGDTIGVIVVTPLAIIWSGRAGRRWRAHRMQITVPIVLAVALVVMSFISASSREQHRIDSGFRNTVATTEAALNHKLDAVLDSIVSLQSLYESSSFVTHEEFRIFTRRQLEHHNELLALSWNPYVTNEQRMTVENTFKTVDGQSLHFVEHRADGAIVPAAQADEYVIVHYIEPAAQNVAAIGFNVMSESVRREAIKRALLSRQPAATGGLQLVQSQKQGIGLLVFVPVYRQPGNTGVEVSDTPDGFVVAVILVNTLVRQALEGLPLDRVSVQLFEAPDTLPPIMQWSNDVSGEAEIVLFAQRSINFAGRDWRLDMSVANDYIAAQRSSGLWFILAGGLLMSGMLGAFLMVLTGHMFREHKSVNQLKRVNVQLEHSLNKQRSFQQELSTEKARAEATLNSIADGVISVDANGRIEYMNPVAESLTGWNLLAARGRELAEVFRLHVDGQSNITVDPATLCLGHSSDVDKQRELCLMSRNGNEFAIRQSTRSLELPGQDTCGLVIAFQDVTEARSLARDIAHQATHDPLTGLVNRAEFERRLMQLIGSAKRHEFRHTICYMDLDHFKHVNDSAGHGAGDELLKGICGQIRHHVRERDTLARLGGDEFGLLLEHCPLDRAREIAEKIITDVGSYELQWNDRVFSVGISIGVVKISSTSGNSADLMRRADMACYTAKSEGRNCVFVPDTANPATRRIG